LTQFAAVSAEDIRTVLSGMLVRTPARAVHGQIRKMPTLADYRSRIGLPIAA